MSRLLMQEIIDRYEDLYKKIEVYGQFMKRLEKGHKLNPIEIATYKEYKLIAEWLKELQHYKDLEEQGRLIELPCKVGDELYRITYPYRQPPKVTKYRVKNFRTIKRGQKLQLEVQADCVPARNWMYFKDFYTSREEAEKALAELGGKDGTL